jgi:hypothetical protein
MTTDEDKKLRAGWLHLVPAMIFFVVAGFQWFEHRATWRAAGFTLAGILFLVGGIRRLRG